MSDPFDVRAPKQGWKVKHKWATVWLLIRADVGGLTGNEWGSLDSTLFLAQRGINPSPRCFTGMKLQLPSKVNGDWRCCSSKVGGGNNPRWCDVWRSCYIWSDWFASQLDSWWCCFLFNLDSFLAIWLKHKPSFIKILYCGWSYHHKKAEQDSSRRPSWR